MSFHDEPFINRSVDRQVNFLAELVNYARINKPAVLTAATAFILGADALADKEAELEKGWANWVRENGNKPASEVAAYKKSFQERYGQHRLDELTDRQTQLLTKALEEGLDWQSVLKSRESEPESEPVFRRS